MQTTTSVKDRARFALGARLGDGDSAAGPGESAGRTGSVPPATEPSGDLACANNTRRSGPPAARCASHRPKKSIAPGASPGPAEWYQRPFGAGDARISLDATAAASAPTLDDCRLRRRYVSFAWGFDARGCTACRVREPGRESGQHRATRRQLEWQRALRRRCTMVGRRNGSGELACSSRRACSPS